MLIFQLMVPYGQSLKFCKSEELLGSEKFQDLLLGKKGKRIKIIAKSSSTLLSMSSTPIALQNLHFASSQPIKIHLALCTPNHTQAPLPGFPSIYVSKYNTLALGRHPRPSLHPCLYLWQDCL